MPELISVSVMLYAKYKRICYKQDTIGDVLDHVDVMDLQLSREEFKHRYFSFN